MEDKYYKFSSALQYSEAAEVFAMTTQPWIILAKQKHKKPQTM